MTCSYSVSLLNTRRTGRRRSSTVPRPLVDRRGEREDLGHRSGLVGLDGREVAVRDAGDSVVAATDAGEGADLAVAGHHHRVAALCHEGLHPRQ